MARWSLSLFIWACVAGTAVPATALASAAPQESQDSILPARVIGSGYVEFVQPDIAAWERRLLDLRQWVDDYETWKRWNAIWRNKREPGWLHARDRRVRPDPPAWLGAECRDVVFEDEEIVTTACRLWAEWNDDQLTAQARQQTASARKQHEAPTKTIWWEHIHLDGLWPMTQWSSSIYGVLGVHATVEVAGRFQVFVAPGAILLNLPNGHNAREWRPATDYGIAYRLFDFTMPGVGRRASLHLNLAKAWVLAGPANVVQTSVDLAGFSVTLKRKP